MITFIGILLFVIFLFLGGLHIFWAFDGQWGIDGVFPTKNEQEVIKMPGKIPTLTVAFGLLAFGGLALIKSGIIYLILPMWLDSYGVLLIAGIFILRAIGEFNYVGLFKKVKNTPFGRKDSKYYTPLCLLIGGLLLILEFLSR